MIMSVHGTVEPPNNEQVGNHVFVHYLEVSLKGVLYWEVSLKGVLYWEVSFIWNVLYRRFHCSYRDHSKQHRMITSHSPYDRMD